MKSVCRAVRNQIQDHLDGGKSLSDSARYHLRGCSECREFMQTLEELTDGIRTDLDREIDRVGTDYVIMWRQKASDVVFPDDLATICQDLETGIKKLEGCRYQIVLRELQTLAGHPKRLHKWTQIAKETAARHS